MNRDEIIARTTNMGFPAGVSERVDRMFIRYVRHQVGDILTSSHPASTKKNVVTEMLKDETTQTVLSEFPIHKLSKKQQIVMWLMRYNCQYALKLLFKIKR